MVGNADATMGACYIALLYNGLSARTGLGRCANETAFLAWRLVFDTL